MRIQTINCPRFLALLGLGGLLCVARPATALRIDLIDVGTAPMRDEQLAAFQEAVRLWEAKFSDPITVTVNISFKDLGAGILGETITARTTHDYADVLAALIANATARSERDALADLPPGLNVPVTDINGNRDDSSVTLGTANAKALGLGTGLDWLYGDALPNDADASIAYANAFADTFDYDRSDGIDADKYDFIGVAAHEIGHALGFFSLTDVQDGNAGFVLHPSPLDLWRFAETGGFHDLAAERRRITCGAAEYYDGVWLNVSFSRGVLCPDGQCGTADGFCQASHWRDTLNNQLMDPTFATAERKNIHPDDQHALNYIGYELTTWPWARRDFGIIPRALEKWYCLTCPAKIPPNWKDPWPPLPDSPPMPFQANLATVVALEMSLPGEPVSRLRSAAGFARFESARTNPYPVLKGLPPKAGQQQLFPPPVRPTMLPPALTDLSFVSDRSNGVPFSARALFSSSGVQYDPSLGPFGGYRVTLALDGEGDGVTGDVDALMTMVLLADSHKVPDPTAENEFQLQPNLPDNAIQVFDALALGLCDAGAPRTEQEANNTPATANALGAVGFVGVLGSIGAPADVDYYRFTAPSNSRVWITVDTGGAMGAGATSRDCVLALFAGDGVTVIETDDNDGSGNGGDGTLETGDASANAGRNLVPGGNYFVRVSAAAPGAIIRPYRLFLTVTAGPIPNEAEPNNTPPTANLILPLGAVYGVRAGTLANTSDLDYYAVQVSGRSVLHVSADGDPERNGVGTDVQVDLLGPGGALLLFSANSSAAGAAANPPAEGYWFLVPNAGTYYVRVKDASSALGTYRLMVAACRTRPPGFAFEHVSGKLRLMWPADAYGYGLQSSTDLSKWVDITLAPQFDNDSIIVEVPANSPVQFFRLKSAD